jgi:hypothetical protein
MTTTCLVWFYAHDTCTFEEHVQFEKQFEENIWLKGCELANKWCENNHCRLIGVHCIYLYENNVYSRTITTL